MADILKVTAPVVSRNVVSPDKAVQDPSVPFDLQEINHIVKNPQSSELLGQHNVFQNETGAAALMNLLKDPDVTVNYMKNIYMLEEIINLLPVNNHTMTQEIRQLFQELLIHPEQIVEELSRQEYSSTLFKGELFDFLREAMGENPSLRLPVSELLKAINGTLVRADVLDSVANSLDYISDSMAGSSVLSARLAELASQCRRAEGNEDFQTLKQQVLAILKNVEESILYSPKIEKVVPLIVYNLSRFQDNSSYLDETLLNVLVMLNGRESKETLRELVREYIGEFSAQNRSENHSRVMNILAEIIGKQERETDISSLNGDKIEKIITSLLSSPCNYTPLLHFVIPVEYMGLHAFSELWVDPNDSGDTKDSQGQEQGVHMLITFDIHEIGQFEAEFMVSGKDIRFYLYCPERYTDIFAGLTGDFRNIMEEHGYHMSDVKIDKLDKIRSLMDVFKTLPYKRTGIDVRI